LDKTEALRDYLKLVRPSNWCTLMKERMPFKKSVRMAMCDSVLMICLPDFPENSV